jgi:hypothetical protein
MIGWAWMLAPPVRIFRLLTSNPATENARSSEAEIIVKIIALAARATSGIYFARGFAGNDWTKEIQNHCSTAPSSGTAPLLGFSKSSFDGSAPLHGCNAAH